jgi:hypothetical protein
MSGRYIEKLDAVVDEALPPRMWKHSKEAQRESAREAKRRRDQRADEIWGTLCVDILSAETPSFV